MGIQVCTGQPAPTAERASHLELNGLRLLCREWGPAEGYPIVLLHGLRGYSATWRRLAVHLSGSYRLIAIDQRGRGQSDWDSGRNYYTDAYLADLEALVDTLKLRRFVLVGHSMGGATAYVYAARHADRLAALVIEDIAPGSSTEGEGAERIRNEMSSLPSGFTTRAEARAYWRARRPSLGDAEIEERIAETMRQDPGGRWIWRYDAAGISAARLNPDPARVIDLWPVVARITAPTLLIRGGNSDFCPTQTVARMCAINPHFTSVTVPGASHYVHDDRPAAYNQLVARFIAEHLPEVP